MVVSKYEKMQKKYSEDYCWQKEYMSFPDVQLLSAAAADQVTKYIDGEIQSISMIRIWGKEVGNITVTSYGPEIGWKLYQTMLQE